MTLPQLSFKYPWRDYQARILDRLELYRAKTVRSTS